MSKILSFQYDELFRFKEFHQIICNCCTAAFFFKCYNIILIHLSKERNALFGEKDVSFDDVKLDIFKILFLL